MDYQSIRNKLLVPLEDRELVSLIKEISFKFTQKREDIGDYVLDEKMVSAYAAFYLPTNLPKFDFLMSQLSVETRDQLKECTFIDYGCGPGTYGLGFNKTFDSRKIQFIDKSSLMLQQAQKIIGDGFKFLNEYQEVEGKKCLFFGNSLNEMELSYIEKLIEKIDPDFIGFIEPGTKEFFSKALEIRSYLARKEYGIHFPCSSNLLSCPMEKKKREDWCHQVLYVTHDQELEKISQMSKLDRRTLPFISHFYEKGISKNQKARLVRFIKETKFSYIWEVCYDLELLRIEFMKKGLIKKKIPKIPIGSEIRFKVLKEIKDGPQRVEILNQDELF